MVQEQRCKPHRFAAQVRADCRFGRYAVITLIEEQIKSPLDRGQAVRKFSRGADIEKNLGRCQHLLCPGDAFLDRCVAGDEGARNFVDAEPAQDVQHERDLRLFG